MNKLYLYATTWVNIKKTLKTLAKEVKCQRVHNVCGSFIQSLKSGKINL